MIETRAVDCLFVCLFDLCERPYSGYVRAGRRMLMGIDALLQQHIATDLLYALSHIHDNTMTRPLINQTAALARKIRIMPLELYFLKQTDHARLEPGQLA